MRLKTGFSRQDSGHRRRNRRQAGDRRWETGARGRQETGDGIHGEDKRQKKGDGRQCSDVQSGCMKIELMLLWRKKISTQI